MRWVVFLFASLFLFSCKKDDSGVVPNQPTAEMKITVRKSYTNTSGTTVDSTIRGAMIYLYLTTEDRRDNVNMQQSGKTDDVGLARFASLHKEFYYVAVSYPAFGTKYIEVSTPPNTVALEEVVF